jgi:hypothetical protein
VQADLLIVTNRSGDVLGVLGDSGVPPKAFAATAHRPGGAGGAARPSTSGRRAAACCRWCRCRSRSIPAQPEVLGTLTARPPPRSPAGRSHQGHHPQRRRVRRRRQAARLDAWRPITAALLAVPDDGRLLRATVDGEEYEAVRRRV